MHKYFHVINYRVAYLTVTFFNYFNKKLDFEKNSCMSNDHEIAKKLTIIDKKKLIYLQRTVSLNFHKIYIIKQKN